jgi:serine/threonine-protein phosphatase 2B catalytic subunit
MLLAVLSVCSEEELDTDSDGEIKEEHAAEQIRLRREQIKNKIRAVGRMQRVFTLLREEAESATELVIPTDPNATPVTNQLAVNGAQMSRGIKSFEDAYVLLHVSHVALQLTLHCPLEFTQPEIRYRKRTSPRIRAACQLGHFPCAQYASRRWTRRYGWYGYID